MSLLWGWDAAAIVYVVWVVCTVFRLNEKRTSVLASREDPDRATVDIVMFLASIASLAAIVFGLTHAGSLQGSSKTIAVATCVLSVMLSWALVHCIFTLRYARLYYSEPKGGIDFHSDDDPNYLDFAYMAFTVGMTFQVSDTDVSSRPIRRVVLRHALVSYLFGTAFVATTINFIAGLVK